MADIRTELRKVLEQRLAEIFDQISPEKINAAIEQIISGVSRVSLGSAGGKRIRIRTEELQKNLNQILSEINKQAIEDYKKVVQDSILENVKKAYLRGTIHIETPKGVKDEFSEERARIAEERIANDEIRRQREEKLEPKYKGAVREARRTLEYQGNLSPEQIDKVTKRITEEAERLNGLDANITKVSASSKRLSEDTIGVVTSFSSEEKKINSLKEYVVGAAKSFEILTDAQMRAAQQSKVGYTPKELSGYQAQFPKAFQKAEELGFEPEKLKKVYKEASTETSRLAFVSKDANGVITTLNLTVDKFGRTLVDNQRRFRGFGESIIRNTSEVLRWSIAVSLIYGPMYKLQELVTTAIDNQAKLADITIAVGHAQSSANAIFQDAAKAAQAAGESLNGVLEGYADAYRAAGGVADSTERTVVANKLLIDSLVLSKLSTLNQKEALDVLSGSLRQVQSQLVGAVGTSSDALQKGVTLLDKWVAVSNRANVDLATMATAFSITSESAENAGVSIDELNGIIGSLSEKIGGLGGRETGNAVRALIGGVYTDAAAKALQQYGISVTDTSGRMREFLDIMNEVYQLNQRGLISDTQLNKLALTLGGGVRRGQQYLAFLTDLNRVQEISAVSSKAHGDAEEALSIKLGTVQSSITRLGNAFQELAQTMGTKGGILDVIKGFIDLSSQLVKGIDIVIGALGKAGPILATAGLAYVAFFRGRSGALTGGISDALMGLTRSRGREPYNIYEQGNMMMAVPTSPGRGERFSRNSYVTGGIAGAGIGIASSLGYMSQGGTEGWAKAGVTIGTSIAGTLITGGNPIGGVIGSAIAQFFIGKLEESKGRIEDIFKPIYEPVPGEPRAGTTAETTRVGKLATEYYGAGTLGAQVDTMLGNLSTGILQALGINVPAGGGGRLHGAPAQRLSANMTDFQRATYEAQETISRGVGGIFNFKRITEADVRKAYEFLKAYQDAVTSIPIEAGQLDIKGSRLQGISGGIGQKYLPQIDQIAKDFMSQLRSQLYKGDIRAKQYAEQGQATTGFAAAIPKYFTVMTTESERLTMSEDQVIKKFQEIGKVLAEGSAEDKTYVGQLVDEIFTLNAGLDKVKETGKDFEFGDELLNAPQIIEKINSDTEILVNTFKVLQKEISLRGVQLPTTLSLPQITSQQFKEQVVPLGRQIWEDYLSPLDEGQKALSKSQAEGLNVILELISGYQLLADSEKIPLEFLQKAFDQLKEQGKISVKDQRGIGFQTFNVTNAILQQVAAQSIAMATQWQSAYGYQPDIQDQITIDKNGIIDPMKADWKIVQYLLGQIADNTEKTVDGIFNLPENASFWFPSGLLPYLQAGGGGGGGAPPTVKGGGGTVNQSQLVLGGAEKMGTTRPQVAYNPLSSAYTTPTAQPSILDLLKTWGIFPATNWGKATAQYSTQLGSEPSMQSLLENYGIMPQTKVEEQKPLSFKLELESRTQLIVDGRVLADIIKPYLGESLVQTDGTQGGAVLKVAI